MNTYPKYVSVMNENGDIIKVLYKDIKEHEEDIIEQNLMYGIIHAEYSDKEISDYEKQAYKELRELKRQIRENPNVVLKLDEITERYVVADL